MPSPGEVANSVEAWDERARGAETDHGAALWSSEGMRRRHEAIMRTVVLGWSDGDVVYDHGCGTGALASLLDGIPYVGWDRSPEMRARARRRSSASANFPEEMPDHADHVVACGVYNLRDGWSEGATAREVRALWERYLPRTLVVTLRTVTFAGVDGWSDGVHINYRPGWAADLAASLSDDWSLGKIVPNEMMMVVRL